MDTFLELLFVVGFFVLSWLFNQLKERAARARQQQQGPGRQAPLPPRPAAWEPQHEDLPREAVEYEAHEDSWQHEDERDDAASDAVSAADPEQELLQRVQEALDEYAPEDRETILGSLPYQLRQRIEALEEEAAPAEEPVEAPAFTGFEHEDTGADWGRTWEARTEPASDETVDESTLSTSTLPHPLALAEAAPPVLQLPTSGAAWAEAVIVGAVVGRRFRG